MSAFKLDESKLNPRDYARLEMRRLVVDHLTDLRNSVKGGVHKLEIDKAALDHARKMLANAEDAPRARLRRRVRASAAWRGMAALDQQANNASIYKVRAAIIAELKLSAYEIEMADHYSLLPMGGV